MPQRPCAGRGRRGRRAGRAAAGRARSSSPRRRSSSSSSRALGLGGVELGGDQRVVLGAQIDLVVVVGERADALGLGARLETLLALEGLDLLDGDLELVRDPRVGPPLADPGADAIQLWS